MLPHTQRSWIGKAHIVGATVKPTYYRPGTLYQNNGTVHRRPLPSGAKGEEWILVDGTPASCVQIGLYHFFQDRGPIDMVVSGPNYGRNTTALFGLSSGTIGGALEAAVCRKKAVALSYAYMSGTLEQDVIASATKISVKILEHLFQNWKEDVDVYSVNVPFMRGVESRKIFYTPMLQNYWTPKSCFQETEADDEDEMDPQEHEQHIRQEEEADTEANPATAPQSRHKHRHFRWAPRFTDVYDSVKESAPGNDGWVVEQGNIRYPSLTYAHSISLSISLVLQPNSYIKTTNCS